MYYDQDTRFRAYVKDVFDTLESQGSLKYPIIETRLSGVVKALAIYGNETYFL